MHLKKCFLASYHKGQPCCFQAPPGLTKGKLYGCVGDVTVDGKPVGVYNFKSSEGQCNACNYVYVLSHVELIYGLVVCLRVCEFSLASSEFQSHHLILY